MVPALSLQPGPGPVPGATPWPLAPAGLRHALLLQAPAHRRLLAPLPSAPSAEPLPRGEWLRRWRLAQTEGQLLVLHHLSGQLEASPERSPAYAEAERTEAVAYRLRAQLWWDAAVAQAAARLAEPFTRWHLWLVAAQAAAEGPEDLAYGSAVACSPGLSPHLTHDAPTLAQLDVLWRQSAPLLQGPAPLPVLPDHPMPELAWLTAATAIGVRRGESQTVVLGLHVSGSDEWPTLELSLPSGLSAAWVQSDGGVALTLSATAQAPLGFVRPSLVARIGLVTSRLALNITVSMA